jgi:VanZ family protein
VTVLCLMPQPPRLSTGWDKSNHALAFAALAFTAVWALWPRRAWWVLAAALLAYGGAIEIAQSLLPPRTAEWGDLLADGVGIALGLAAARALCMAEMP